MKDKILKQYILLGTGKFVNLDKGDDTDERVFENHYISVVPIQFDLTDYQLNI